MNNHLGEHFRTYLLHYILIAVCLVVFVLGGRNLYVLFLLIITGFGILLKRIKPQEVFLLVLLSALFYLPLFETFAKLRDINKQFVSNVDEIVPAVFTPDSGLDMLPKRVWAGNVLMKEHGVERYQISKVLADDWEIYQRSIEGHWPRQLDKTSPFWLITEHEKPAYLKCETLDELEAILLVRCD